jgi:hypothetical protein
MKKHTALTSRLFSGIAFTVSVAAGCGVAVESEGTDTGTRPPVPDLRPDLPDYEPDEDGVSRLRTTESVLRQSKVRGTANGGNADGVHGCVESLEGGQATYYHYEHDGNANDTQLHVIGINDSATGLYNDEDSPGVSFGPVHVKLDRPGKSVLVLSTYGAVEWNIDVAEGATLEGIILNGYEESRVNAPKGVPVLQYSIEGNGEYLGTSHDWPSYPTTDLVDKAEIITGLELTSFRGCYGSDLFEIDEPGELRPPHEVSPSPEPRILPGCEALTAESNHCLVADTYRDDRGDEPLVTKLQMVGLDSGTVCGSLPVDLDVFATASLAWMGDYAYMCSHNRGLARISLIDGSIDIASLPCDAVAVQNGGLVVLFGPIAQSFLGGNGANPWYVARFASFEDAVEREPEVIYEMAPWASRMAAHGDSLYFAWHATDTIELANLADGAEFQSITLEGFDTWVNGLDVTDDGTLVVGSNAESVEGDPYLDSVLHLFDAATGTWRSTFENGFENRLIAGLDCQSGGAAE